MNLNFDSFNNFNASNAIRRLGPNFFASNNNQQPPTGGTPGGEDLYQGGNTKSINANEFQFSPFKQQQLKAFENKDGIPYSPN